MSIKILINLSFWYVLGPSFIICSLHTKRKEKKKTTKEKKLQKNTKFNEQYKKLLIKK